MNLNSLKLDIIPIIGILIVIAFCIFTFTSLAFFPMHYTPLSNWLSDLGNSSYNPQGFIFFNIGCIFTGIMLLFFIFGLNKWHSKDKRQRNLLIVGQIIGIVSAISLIMIGVFSEDYGIKHLIFSASFFISLFFVLILTNLSLLMHSKFKRGTGYYGLFAALMDLILIIIFIIPNEFPKPLFKWLAVFISLGWIGLLAYNMLNYKN